MLTLTPLFASGTENVIAWTGLTGYVAALSTISRRRENSSFAME